MTYRCRFKPGSIYLWHRHIGITSALLVLILAITGLMLQHSDALSLSQKHIKHSWILNWYGIDIPPAISYQTKNHWLTQVGETMYLDGSALAGKHEPLTGVIETPPLLIISYRLKVSVFTISGDLVDSISVGNGLPEPVYGIALVDNEIILRGSKRNWKTDNNLLNVHIYNGSANWSQPDVAPEIITDPVIKQYSNTVISWERLLLDVHSGRLFGRFGTWVMDTAAIALIFMAVTGLWIWTHRK